MRLISLTLFLILSGAAFASECPPETHYPCGSSSCCPK
jgi:hypothetical protein